MTQAHADEQRRTSRDRLRSGFLAASVRNLREWSTLLAHGDASMRDAVVHELERMSETARTFNMEELREAAEASSAGVQLGEGAIALDPAARAVRAAGGSSRFPPVEIVAKGPLLDRMRVEANRCCETVAFFESVAAMQQHLRTEDPQAIVVPYEALGELSEEDRRFPVLVYGPGDLDARIAATGVASFFPERVEFRLLLERIRWQTWLRRATAPRALLLAEDGEALAAALEARGVPARLATAPADLVSIIGEGSPDAILVGATVAGRSASELCRAVRGHPRYADLTMVALAPDADSVGLLEAGLDFVLDPALGAEELSRRVAALVARSRSRESGRDVCTGLGDRAVTLRAVDRAVSEARRGKGTMSVALLEPEGLEGLQKRAGPGSGDAAVRLITRCLEGAVRANDVVGRLGGDTFLVLFPGCTAEQARRRLTDVRTLFHTLAAKDDRVTGASFSTGTADTDDGVDRLLSRAEESLERVRARDARGAVG